MTVEVIRSGWLGFGCLDVVAYDRERNQPNATVFKRKKEVSLQT